jgi:hypothetical protein
MDNPGYPSDVLPPVQSGRLPAGWLVSSYVETAGMNGFTRTSWRCRDERGLTVATGGTQGECFQQALTAGYVSQEYP